jgi:predicted nucleic acid-binding protein
MTVSVNLDQNTIVSNKILQELTQALQRQTEVISSLSEQLEKTAKVCKVPRPLKRKSDGYEADSDEEHRETKEEGGQDRCTVKKERQGS